MKKSIFAVATALALACLLALGSAALAAKGGDKGPPDGGEGAGVNQLSFPAIYTMSIDAYWNVKADPVLGVDYSYGCAEPEESGIYKYPNTSCVDDLMNPTVYDNEEQCAAGKCQGQTVHPIYWQKNPANLWSPDQDVKTVGGDFVEYLDWGDALEAVSWNTRSKIRVETQPYSSTIFEFDPSVQACAAAAGEANRVKNCKVGFQMWHVSGQGITEHWGVRADEATGDSYNYDSPFQIIKTDTAMLNLAKLELGSSECPSPGGGDEEVVVLAAGYEIPDAGSWEKENNKWTNAVYTKEVSYSVETSVGGKYVYGYNLDMNALAITEGVEKAGWWRLTFYTTDGAVQFYDPLVSAPDIPPEDTAYYYQLTAPPAVPVAARSLPAARSDRAAGFFITDTTAAAEPAVSELYQPVVDVDNNLTYLDICVVAKDQSGGGGGGGGGGNGGGDGGAGIGGGKPSTTKNFDKVRGQGNKGKGHNK